MSCDLSLISSSPPLLSLCRDRATGAFTDALEVRRLGSPGGVRVRISLDLQRDGDDVALTDELAAVIGTK